MTHSRFGHILLIPILSFCRTVEIVCRLIYEEKRLFIHEVGWKWGRQLKQGDTQLKQGNTQL